MSGSTVPDLFFKIGANNDDAVKKIDAINKRVDGITGAAGRFGDKMKSAGDTSGLTRLAEGFKTFNSGATDAFRAVDRLGPAMGALTGAASIAGMTALVQRWSQLGQQTYLTGQRLRMPTDRLTALRGAARLAGASAEDLDGGLGSLDERLRGATFRGDAGAIQTFNQLGVNFGKVGVEARKADEAFYDVADGIKRLYDSGEAGKGAALRAAQNLGLEALFPLLIKGRAGVQALAAETARLGGVIPPEAAKRADELQTSFSKLETAIGGVANRLGDKWGTIAKPYVDFVTETIANNKSLSDSWVETGIKFGSFVSALLLARKLFPKLLSRLGPLGLLSFVGAGASEDAPENKRAFDVFNRNQVPSIAPNGLRSEAASDGVVLSHQGWVSRHAPTWMGGAPGFSSADPRGLRNNNPLNLSYLPGQGAIGSDGRFGVYKSMEDGVAAAERQLLRYQDQGDNTVRKIISRWAPPSENDTEGYIAKVSRDTGFDPNEQLNLRYPGQAQSLIAAMSRVETGRALDPHVIQSGVDQGLHGTVNVNIQLQGAPPGTRATATTSGPVTAAPPQIQTAMPSTR